MRGRLGRVVALTTAVAVALVLLALVVGRTPAERHEIAAADDAAAAFRTDLDRHLDRLAVQLTEVYAEDDGDVERVHEVLAEGVGTAPRVPRAGTTARGRDGSDAYRTAAAARRVALEPYAQLQLALERQVLPAHEFVEAGKALVKVSPAKLLRKQDVVDGEPLRDKVEPAFTKARDRLEDVAVPAGQEKLRKDLDAYAKKALKQTRDGAETLDDGEEFFFDLGKTPDRLYVRLETYDRQLSGSVGRRLDAIAVR